MFDELNRRIMQTKERSRSKRKLEAMLEQVQQSLREMRRKSSKLQKRLAAEKADVDKLESMSLTGLFYSVLGTKTEHLDKEREEYLAAKLKYDENCRGLEDVQKEVDRLRLELESIQTADDDYEQLLREKEHLLATRNDSQTKRMLELSEQLSDLKSDRKELAEAVSAGDAALRVLEQVRSDLQSAANWGTFDLVGGGMLATMAKHSKIDAAKQHAHDAQRYLRRFQQELAEADSRLNVSLEIGGFSKFADYFFDGLIADWVVQTKIRDASSACSTTISQVASSIGTCRRRLADVEREIETVDQQRRELIENADC